MKHSRIHAIIASGLFTVGWALNGHAQSADALINKLVEKGILNVKEANDLREESERDFNQAIAVKTGMPDWVTALKFSGDVRARYEGFYANDEFVNAGRTNSFADRSRYRFRLRFGVNAILMDNLETGFRLSSADSAFGNNSGNPISGNSTFQDNASRKILYIDQAFLKWSALNGPDWTGVLTVGKMESPFVLDEMVIDLDYMPEGAAIQTGYRFNDRQALKFNAGGFVLDEIDVSSNDPYLLAAQARWDAVWTPKVASSIGLSALTILGVHSLTNSSVPNVNRGNTRNADGTPTHSFNPIVADGSFTYTAETFPFYKGPFPIRVSGEYMNNPAAPSSADNYAWNAGLTLGKSGKRGTWELSYFYKWLGANSWWEELVDDDFGAFYGALNSPPNSGFGIGYGGGTNVKGHIIRLAYSATDSLTLSVKLFITDLINEFPSGSDSHMNRIQVDGMLRF